MTGIRKPWLAAALLLAALFTTEFATIRSAHAVSGDQKSALSEERRARLVRLLVFDHLTAVNDACQSKNFSVLRAKASPNFREKYSEADLDAMFPHCGPRALDLRRFLLQDISLGTIAVDEKKLFLGLKGHIDDNGLRLGFEFQFESVEGEWKLSVLSLALSRLDDKIKPSA